MSAGEAAVLAAAVRRAVEEAEADLARMPFFVRPMVRRGFARRTGHSHEAWRARLADVLSSDTPAGLRARRPELAADLARLAEDFREAPARARRAMGEDPRLAEVEARARGRVASVEAFLSWLSG